MKQKKESKAEQIDPQIKKKFINAYLNFVTDDLMYILENIGEDAFKKNARYFYLTEKEIDEIIKLWREEKHESNNTNSV